MWWVYPSITNATPCANTSSANVPWELTMQDGLVCVDGPPAARDRCAATHALFTAGRRRRKRPPSSLVNCSGIYPDLSGRVLRNSLNWRSPRAMIDTRETV
ncbi:hypothetical protein EVAR_3931_1 [Eumeta japonica]|uniref:Uncharacterized protein n=1 Tax=Eumeta variegata TaxID=151549 RepID=A0A4C1SRJ7_EUMVA|nr:hypothetical protein EVAR_3931_1 [Eumeta japonica]